MTLGSMDILTSLFLLYTLNIFELLFMRNSLRPDPYALIVDVRDYFTKNLVPKK